jgi:hypothetical protein
LPDDRRGGALFPDGYRGGRRHGASIHSPAGPGIGGGQSGGGHPPRWTSVVPVGYHLTSR